MAKSKRTRVATPQTSETVRVCRPKQQGDNLQITQEAIDHHWIPFPAGAKEFILEKRDRSPDLPTLINFWSSPQNIEFTRDRRAGCINRAAWYLALVHSKLGMYKEARSLTVNGSFIHQCCNSSIEYIISLFAAGGTLPRHKLPYFSRGVDSIRSSKAMESFIQSYLPPEDTQLMTSYANMHDKNYVRGYIDRISDDWNGGSAVSSPKKVHCHPLPFDDETQITLTLVDDLDRDNRHSFNIGSLTTLKALFNDYADERGISLRSLRFSYMDKTLFLSNAGYKTPNELGIRDHDVIMVHNATQSKSIDDECSRPRQTHKKTEAKKKSNKKAKRKNQRQTESVKTLEEYKVQHSTQLTKIHEEAQEHFRQIRQRLNNLVIDRRQPKIKSKRPQSPKKEPSLPPLDENSFRGGIGGKAGKSRFAVHVGEVKNLYKTTKLSAVASSNCSSSSALLTLDLHGCTRQEALAKLDHTLEVWVDTAMRGSYPFVLPATIVCGCGNQILSETVQQWIRSNDQVSNTPKLRQSKR